MRGFEAFKNEEMGEEKKIPENFYKYVGSGILRNPSCGILMFNYRMSNWHVSQEM